MFIYIYAMYIDQVRLGPHAHKGSLFLSLFFNSLAWIFRVLCTQMYTYIHLFFKDQRFLEMECVLVFPT